MPVSRPTPRYNRSQRALLLIRHYAKNRVGVPLAAFVLIIAAVMCCAVAAGIMAYAIGCALTHLFPGRFLLERDFLSVWLPCMIAFVTVALVCWHGKIDAWETHLTAALTSPPPAERNEPLTESEILVRASIADAPDSLLTPASAPPDAQPETLLRASKPFHEKFPGDREK